MSRPQIIGLHGKAGAGKDTVFERLTAHYPALFKRASFADALKDSASALLKVDRERMEILKRQEFPCLHVTLEPPTKANPTPARVAMTMREFLQRYGTEAHRDIPGMGPDFWVDIARRKIQHLRHQEGMLRIGPSVIVFTDCRFENEAHAVLDMGGEVWQVIGPDEDTGAHASETPLDASLISRYIDNRARATTSRRTHIQEWTDEPDFTRLDEQLATIINEWSLT